jgi:uncharacterized protein Veg
VLYCTYDECPYTPSALQKGNFFWKVVLIGMDSITKIREDLEGCIGKKVRLKANKGRKKTTIREGILESAYPSLFVVRINNDYDNARIVSYTYSDVLTSTVEITILED